MEIEFLSLQTGFSQFIAKCMSDQGFMARRGLLELAMSIEACMLSWLEVGCLSTPPGNDGMLP